MIPAKEKVLVCPHCGGEKSIIQITSGNTIGGHQWWDMKADFPMLPIPSPIQKCSQCKKYYHIESASSYEGDNYSFDKGELSYEEAKEAWSQLKDTLSGGMLTSLALVYIHAYNDKYQRVLNKENTKIDYIEPKEADLEEFRSVVYTLIDNFQVESPLIYAEFLREARLFDEAMKIANSTDIPKEGVYANLYTYIVDNCRKKNSLVYIVEF